MYGQAAHDTNKDPQEYKFARAASARSKGDVVYLGKGANGNVDLDLVDDILVHELAVANEPIASGEGGQYVTEGEVEITVPSGNYTAGNGLVILDGAVADSGSAYPATGIAGEAKTVFGVIKTGGTAVTSITVSLDGGKFTATT